MCGRYTTEIETDESELFEILMRASAEAPALALPPMRDVYPSEPAAVLTESASSPFDVHLFRWGYPTETKNGKRGQLIINARSETAAEKAMFSGDLSAHRCIIPTAGFYEWSHTGAKLCYRFNAPETGILHLAGLYRPIRDGSDKYAALRYEFVILTTAANDSMAAIHDRMPVILRPEHTAEWLGSEKDAKRLLLEPPPMLTKKWVG